MGDVTPQTETCDGRDEDCDGIADNGTNACGGTCPLDVPPGTPCDFAGPTDLDLCMDDAYVCFDLNSTACANAGTDADGDRYSSGPLDCGGDCVDSNAAINPAVTQGCTVSLSGPLSGRYDYSGRIVRFVGPVSVTRWNGSDRLTICDPGDTGCLEIIAAVIDVVSAIDAEGAGGGGGGGGGGGPSVCNMSECTPFTTYGQPGPGGSGVANGSNGSTAGTGGNGGGPAGGLGGASGTWGGCGAASLAGEPGRPGGYLTAGANGDTSSDESVSIGGGGGGGGGGSSNECAGPAGYSGGGGAGNRGGGYVRLIATSTLTVSGIITTAGLTNAAGNGAPGINIESCASASILPTMGGRGGDASQPGSSRPSGTGGFACSETAPSDGGAGGAGGGGGIMLRAPHIMLSGTLNLRGGGASVATGGTLKLFSDQLTGSIGTRYGRVCQGAPGGPCQ